MPLTTARPIDEIRCEVGENPLWHVADQSLYWTDIPTGRIYRHAASSFRSEIVFEGRVVGGFTIQANHSLLLFMADGAIAECKDKNLTTVIEGIADEQGTRFNDVIADPTGRVFCGTMATQERAGRLYRLDVDGKLTKLLDDIQCSNGLAFFADFQYLYYTDSYAYVIYRFQYSVQSGDIRNREVFVRTSKADGYPDGLVRDADGYLWSARWGGGCIIRYAPDGKEDQRIELPAKNVTSLAFGGPQLADIYVTTAKDSPHEGGDSQALGGATFHLKIGVRGLLEFPSRIRRCSER